MDNVFSVDQRQIEFKQGQSILQASLAAGIYIPHICYHPDLRPTGECKLCLVEVEGIAEPVTACDTPAAAGVTVRTNTPKLVEMRYDAFNKMMANHTSDCTTCPKYLNCELQSLKQYIGLNESSYPKSGRTPVYDASNPLFVHDYSRCVLCGRCVRACQELRGADVLHMLEDEFGKYVGTKDNRSLIDAGCRFCGACVEVCPTGAHRDQDAIVERTQGRRIALVACKYTCPAGIDVPRYIRFIREKNYAAALATIREKVPFPGVLGYVCNHPCEAVCRHGEINEAIAIKELKRFAATHGDKSWQINSSRKPATGKNVAVIGSGPAGLTAAYYLAKSGHNVTVFESMESAGGMLRYGIPEYRLPETVLNEEIKEIEDFGVQIRTNSKIESMDTLFADGFNAVLVSIGAQTGQKLNIPGADLEGVLTGLTFLREVKRGNPVKLGKSVLVLGGGSVAFDCARTALRLGATSVSIACLEPRDRMLSTDEEIIEGCDEGITLYNSQSFIRITETGGKVTGVECQKVTSFNFDDEGRLEVECEEDSNHVIPADTVIFAVGQRPEVPDGFGLSTKPNSTIEVEWDDVSTAIEGVFAAGDAVTGTSSVIKAIASGRQAAEAIDSFLGGEGNIDEKLAPTTEPSAWLGTGEGFACLERVKTDASPGTSRTADFNCINETYNEEDATKEAERCLQCDLRLKISKVKFWVDY